MLLKTVFMAIVLAALAPGQQEKKEGGKPPALSIQQVKPGLYVVIGAGANSEIRITDQGVIVVDGKLAGAQNYNALMTQIKAVSDKPVRYLIVTQHHEDHSGNNDRFLAAGVQVVAHENLKKILASTAGDAVPAPPNVTYSGTQHTLKLGRTEVELYHFGRAHTGGDSVVYFPDLKVVAVSDLITVSPTGPRADYEGGGSFVEWSKVLDSVLKLDFDACIPGIGGVLTKADVQAYKVKIDTFVSRAREAVRKGVPKDQLMAQIKTDDFGWVPRVPNVDAFYADLQK